MRTYEFIAEAGTTPEKRIRAAKEKLAKKRPGEGGAAAMAQATHKKNAGPHDKKGYKRNPKHKKDEEI